MPRVPPERDEPFLREARGHAQRGALEQRPAAGGGGRQGPLSLQVSAVQQVFQGGPNKDIYQPPGDHAQRAGTEVSSSVFHPGSWVKKIANPGSASKN